MRAAKLIILIAVAMFALSHRSDGQQARPLNDQLRLSGAMPRGALVYVQARDLSSLMKTWLASPVRTKFYDSASFKAFSEAHVYLKLQSRRQDIEKAIGVGVDESRLAELAGGPSAAAIYNIGNIEVIFVTELARERAIITSLFKQIPQFQERSSDGGPYYVREVATDGGRLNQQFCFAYAGGKLVVTTTEGLMIRSLAAIKQNGSDSLLADVMATAEKARGFSANEVTMWLDQAKLNQAQLFRSYWIYRNINQSKDSSGASEPLANIESGLIDLRITPQGLGERRWFVMKGESKRGVLSNEQANGLLRFGHPSAQLVELRAMSDSRSSLNAAVSEALFGKLPDAASISNQLTDRSDSGDDSGSRSERYSRLDNRFDIDVDDEQAPVKAREESEVSSQKTTTTGSTFEKSFDSIVAAVSPAGYSELVRSKVEAGRPFVRFERALVIEMKDGATIDRSAIERAVIDELRTRFVIAGVDPRLAWQDEAGVRFVAQSLLEQGAAYAISGKYLVLSSSREFVKDILQFSATPPAASAALDGTTEYFALVRVGNAKPVFDSLMNKLDGKTATRAATQSDDETEEVNFFSDNLSSFIAASSVREMRVRRETADGVMIERVAYTW